MSEPSAKYFYDRIEAQRLEIEKLQGDIKTLESHVVELENLLREFGIE